jgi:hypothetical protein
MLVSDQRCPLAQFDSVLAVEARIRARRRTSMNAKTMQRRWGLVALLALALGLAGCEPEPMQRAAPAARAQGAPAAAPTRPSDQGLVLVTLDGADHGLHKKAVRALLTNLIDDGDPPRFNDPHWPIVCAEATQVLVDGEPVEEGQRVPDGSFTLDWTLDGACPLGDGGPLLYGHARMLVLRDDEAGLVPLLLAQP